VKYRSRIVARGFTQIPGADFDATYSPTVQLKTVLCTLRIVTHEDMEMETGDVGNAVSDVMSGGEPGNTEGQNSADSKLKQIVRREIRRVVRGSRGTHTVQATVGMNPMQVIHCRLGHVNPTVALTMLRTGAATGMGYTYDECKGEQLGLCDSCMTGKTDALSVPSSGTATLIELKPFESMHMDLKEMTCNILQRNYVVTWIVDEATDMQYVYHSKDKMDKERIIEQFVREEVLPSDCECVRKLTADCDSNFLDARFRDLCQLIGKRMTLSPLHVHQSNGRAERAIGVGMKSLRTVMARYNSPNDMWQLALDYVIWTRNRIVNSSKRDGKSPWERLTGQKPDLSISRPFDAPSWYFVYKDERTGVNALFRPRVRYCRMVGYAREVKGS
jgi:hypothetical protein